MTVLIDSWAWIEYWKGSRYAEWAAKFIEGAETAIVSAINLAEIYHAIQRDYDEKTANNKTDTVSKRCFIINLDRQIALESARLKQQHKLGLADSIVLATAKSQNARVITGDKDFKHLQDTIYIAD